jgi:hypothetical protein
MPNQDYPSLNDIAPSYADVEVSYTIYDGQLLEMADIAGIKFGDKVEVGEQRGTGGRLRKRTTGSSSAQASMDVYRSGHRKLVKALAAKAPSRGNQKLISLVFFDITINHTPPGEIEIYTVKIKGCRLLGRDFDLKEGNDADKVAIGLNPMELVEVIDGEEIVLL